jgi:hypothetical protein
MSKCVRSLLRGIIRPNRFEDHLVPVTAGELRDLHDAFLAAFGDEVNGAELTARSVRVLWRPTGDLLGAEAPGREHGETEIGLVSKFYQTRVPKTPRLCSAIAFPDSPEHT